MKNEEFPSYSDINYVDQVSCKEIIHYFPSGTSSHSAANSSFFIPCSSFLLANLQIFPIRLERKIFFIQ